MGHDGHPGPEVDENHVKGRINHPGEHGVPVHFPLIHEENIVHQHEDGDEIVENVIVERKVFVADVVQPVGADGAGPNDEMVHEGQGAKTGSYDVAAVRRIEKGHIHPERVAPATP